MASAIVISSPGSQPAASIPLGSSSTPSTCNSKKGRKPPSLTLGNDRPTGASGIWREGKFGAPKGNRTPVFAVKGRRPGPLDDGRGHLAGVPRWCGAATYRGVSGGRQASLRGRRPSSAPVGLRARLQSGRCRPRTIPCLRRGRRRRGGAAARAGSMRSSRIASGMALAAGGAGRRRASPVAVAAAAAGADGDGSAAAACRVVPDRPSGGDPPRAHRHQWPVLGIEAQGSWRGRGSPFCNSSTEWRSGERTNAIWPSRGGRLMVTPAAWRRAQVP